MIGKQKELQAAEVALEERLNALREKQQKAKARAQHVRKKQVSTMRVSSFRFSDR